MERNTQTVLITGGAGYIGTALANKFIGDGHDVVVFDDLSTGQRDLVHRDAFFVEGDVTDQQSLDGAFADRPIDTVIHCAGKKVAPESEHEPSLYFKTNLTGTLNVLDSMARFSVPKIIFSSTCGVYGNETGDKPAHESDATVPVSVYGHSKLMAEILIKEYARLKQIQSYVIFRFFQVAGDAGLNFRDDNSTFVFNILERALKNDKPFYITGTDYDTRDGSGVRDYIHLKDLVEAHTLALAHDTSDVFNIGTNHGCTVRELITTFEQVSGEKVNALEAPRRPGDIASSLADCTYVKEKLGWEAKYTLQDMVASTLDTYRN